MMKKNVLFVVTAAFIVSACTKTQNSNNNIKSLKNNDLINKIITDTSKIPPYRRTLNGEDAFRKDVFEAINQVRLSGCKCAGVAMPKVAALEWNELLANAALTHSKDMVAHDFFDHKGSDGSNVAVRVDVSGYKRNWVGENLLFCANNSKFGELTTVKNLVDSWVSSEGHCKNLMSSKFTQSGVAVFYISKNGIKNEYYTQVFASPR